VTLHILYAAKYFYGNPDLVRLSSELAQRKHRVTAATCLGGFEKPKHEAGVNIFETRPIVTLHRLAYPVSLPYAQMYRIVREQRVDVIHAVDDYSTNTAVAASVSKATKVPFVYTIQGMGTKTGHLPIDMIVPVYDRSIEGLIARSAKRVVLQSKNLMLRADWLGVKKKNMVVIPSGVDLAHFDPEDPEVKKQTALLRSELDLNDNVVVGYVGRLISLKGLAYLVSAVSQVQKENEDVVLLLVGDGPQRAELETMARKTETRVVFAGWQAETAPFYALMDIFVLPSFFEGLPNVMLEAMAMEKAIIASAIGGNVDLVIDGKNGFLVPIRDDQRIASALKKLIRNKDMRKQMGETNRQMVEESFSWDSVVPRFEKLYRILKSDG
jgi:glycosyltransferase involved in cell wall biosynthesis